MNTLTHIPHDASIVILTGAGISAESGLQTFRGDGGLWYGHRVEDVATPEAFTRDPHLVHEFYNMRRKGVCAPDVQPNPAHSAIAALEKDWAGDVLVITQNIDDLHERAGTGNLLHMHGEVMAAFCIHCAHKAPCRNDLSVDAICGKCRKSGGMRPDIVWFGEMPYHMDKIARALETCDLFVSIGTSGHVYPAAGFVREARYYGAVTAEINLERSQNASAFHDGFYGQASRIVPEFTNSLLALHSKNDS